MAKYLLILILSLSVLSAQKNDSRKNMRLMMKWKLTEYLDLNENQAEKFFPRMNSHEKEMKIINNEIKNLKDELDEYILSGSSTKRKNNSILEQIRILEQNKVNLKFNYLNSVDDVLNPSQVSKLLIFENKFRRSLKDQIKNDIDLSQKNKKYNYSR
jgi:hypothetical protein